MKVKYILIFLFINMIYTKCKNKKKCILNYKNTSYFYLNLNNENIEVSDSFLTIFKKDNYINIDSFFAIKEKKNLNIETKNIKIDKNFVKKINSLLYEIYYFRDTFYQLDSKKNTIIFIKEKLKNKKNITKKEKNYYINLLSNYEEKVQTLLNKEKYTNKYINTLTEFKENNFYYYGKVKVSKYFNTILVLKIDSISLYNYQEKLYTIYLINFNKKQLISCTSIHQQNNNVINEYIKKENNFFSKIKIPQRGCIVNPFVNDDSLYLPYKECDFKFDDCGHFILLKNYEKN